MRSPSTMHAFAPLVRREGHFYEVFLVLAKTRLMRIDVKGCSKIRHVVAKSRLILDEMCRLHGKWASYFHRLNGPIACLVVRVRINNS